MNIKRVEDYNITYGKLPFTKKRSNMVEKSKLFNNNNVTFNLKENLIKCAKRMFDMVVKILDTF